MEAIEQLPNARWEECLEATRWSPTYPVSLMKTKSQLYFDDGNYSLIHEVKQHLRISGVVRQALDDSKFLKKAQSLIA